MGHPSSVGPYRIVERLGAGGMGEVHLAVDTRLNRKVALKTLSDPSLDTPRVRSRLLREARAAAQITHPNIAAIYDIIESESDPCIVMEYAQGETLASLASHGPLPCHQVLAIAVQLADALAHAHAAGVVHRDLKPSNIVLTPDGVVKVLDFGLARVSEFDERATAADDQTCEATITRPGMIAGTPAYMAPEQLVGHPASPLSDIYSLGATLFELLTGRKPFEATEARDLTYQILSKPTPLASAVNGLVPPFVDAIVATAMAKEPVDRYASAAQMAEDLRQAVQECSAQPARTASRRLATGSPALAAPVNARRRWMAWIGGIACVVGALGGIWFMLLAPRAAVPLAASQYVAVLPFAASGASDPALDVNAAAFTASIVDGLEGLSSVTVVSRRDTAEHFASPSEFRKGARELGVSMIVSGAVSRVAGGERFLVKVARADGGVVLTRQYTANPGSVAAAHAGAVNDVVSALGVELTPEDRERLTRVPACRADAYPDYAAGRALLDRADLAGNPQKAEAAFLRAVTLDPGCAAGFAGLADARLALYSDTNDPSFADLASRAIGSALTLDGRNPSIQMSVARVYFGQGKADQAEQIVRRVVESRPRDDAPHRLLGDVLDRQGRTEEAVGAYTRAVELRPTNVINYVSLALCYRNIRGRTADEIRAYEQALKIQPDNMYAITNLGAAYYGLGQLDRALVVFSQAPRPDPYILTNVGSIYYAKGAFAEAARAFEQAVALAPGKDIRHRNLGDAYLRLGQRDQAREQYRIAAELTDKMQGVDARNAQVVARHALYEAKLGRAAAALLHIEQAVKLSPDDSGVLYKRAVVHCLLNQPVDAVEWLRRAILKGYSQSSASSDDDLDLIKKRPEVVELLRVGR
jgi:tetratricopeptide (TPR) repeat protein/tRNA A-37 threonylcarbamoyl transferase component Bud32/TolB-like protein